MNRTADVVIPKTFYINYIKRLTTEAASEVLICMATRQTMIETAVKTEWLAFGGKQKMMRALICKVVGFILLNNYLLSTVTKFVQNFNHMARPYFRAGTLSLPV